MMRRQVKDFAEVVEFLDNLSVKWETTNKIHNSMWEKGIAFFDSNYRRVAFYDEVHRHLSIY